MHFAEHGVFEVKIENNSLLVDATGPFNQELTTRYGQAIESCIKQLEASNWDQIIVLHKLSLFTPEAAEVLINTLKNRKTRGLIKSAVVLNNCEGKSLITQQMSNIYQTADVDYCFFDSVAEAKTWISSTNGLNV